MPFPPQQNHRIPLAEAASMTRRYREEVGKGRQLAEMFPREALESLLSQEGARGIRFYFGRGAGAGRLHLIGVAVDADGNDMTSGVLIELGFPCPPVCSGPDELNS